MASSDLPESSQGPDQPGGDVDSPVPRRAAMGGTTGKGARRRGVLSIGWPLSAFLVGLLVGGLAATLLGWAADEGDPFRGHIEGDGYQAVILSNDRVYFGQLHSLSDDFFELRRAFFLRETRESAESEPVRALLPISREIHAPENNMFIHTQEVVLVENLSEDSPILAEIRRQARDAD